MIFVPTILCGAYLVRPEPREDHRGCFARIWCQREFQEHGLDWRVVQCSISTNRRRGTLRGMHYQTAPPAEAKLVRCTKGAVYDVILDLRRDAPTFKQWIACELTDENHNMVYVPAGCAHGFQTLKDEPKSAIRCPKRTVPSTLREPAGMTRHSASTGHSRDPFSPKRITAFPIFFEVSMHQHSPLLTAEQVARFHRDGYLLVRSFYDLTRDIEPIQYGIYRIIGLMIAKYYLSIQQPLFQAGLFDAAFQPLIAHDRRIGSEVYDAVKQIPAFVRLVCTERHDQLLAQLRDTDMPGLAAGGWGIRIDHPGEERYRADWHQDYPGQLRSMDGLVFWSPLVPVDAALGPMRLCRGSHKDGLVPLLHQNPRHPEKTGAYGLVLKDRDARVARYVQEAPLTSPGDLLIIDFQTIHASGANQSSRSRWSMQIRYFNFREPTAGPVRSRQESTSAPSTQNSWLVELVKVKENLPENHASKREYCPRITRMDANWSKNNLVLIIRVHSRDSRATSCLLWFQLLQLQRH